MGGHVEEGAVGPCGNAELGGIEVREAEGGEVRLEPEVGERCGDREEGGRDEGHRGGPAANAAAAGAPGAAVARQRLAGAAERRWQRLPPWWWPRYARRCRRWVAVSRGSLQRRLRGRLLFRHLILLIIIPFLFDFFKKKSTYIQQKSKKNYGIRSKGIIGGGITIQQTNNAKK